MNHFFQNHLFIEGFILNLAVGCEAAERAKKQPIEIDLWFFFAKPPLGCISDELKDTLCYMKCTDIVRNATLNSEFHLIEHLAEHIHKALKKELPMAIEIAVRVSKLTPPVPEVKKGIRFTYFPKQEHDPEKKPSRDWNWE